VRALSTSNVDLNAGVSCGCSSCGEDHLEAKKEHPFRKKMMEGLGVLFFIIAILFEFPWIGKFWIYLLSYLFIGGDILGKALRNLLKGKVFDENFLMSIATIGAFVIGEYPEGVGVMLFYKVGEFFQEMAVHRSKKSIASLMDIRPDFANLKVEDEIKKVHPETVQVGDEILIKPGEKVPLDGIILEGKSVVDVSNLTGEHYPKNVEAGSEILSGSINLSGVFTLQVTKSFGDSTVSKILELVENASSHKAPTEHFITKFAKYYTPFVVAISLLIIVVPSVILGRGDFFEWLYRGLIFLVVSCPCALVISIPLSFFGGIGGASRNGILIKGGNYLEALNHVSIVLLDKTGTLTKGVFQVTDIKPQKGISQQEVLRVAAHVESYSNHPIARSILSAYPGEVDQSNIEGYEELSGYGLKARFEGKVVLAGNRKFMEKEGVDVNEENFFGTLVHLAMDGKYLGTVVVEDTLKEDAKDTVNELRKHGVHKIILLTGDHPKVAEEIGKRIGIDEVYSQLLPQDKVKVLEEMQASKSAGEKIVFMGDGINDSPVIARADIGIAMGGIGSDAAIEAADVVIMNDEPYQLIKAIKIAQKTRKIIWQNIVLSLGVKGIVLFMASFGLTTMWGAVFADVGVALLAILNAVRVYKV
jgi:Zn2+/Cd2+-exporting ATPase